MTDLDKANPEFTVALRGYDRYQVDEYIARMHQIVTAADERARAAEGQTKASHGTVGPRITKMFELANEEIDELRDRADDDVERLLTDARRKAETIVRTAKRSAANVEANSRRQHAELLDDLAQERDDVRAEVSVLERQRSQLADHLRRLHDAIGQFAVVAEDATAPADATQEPERPITLSAVAAAG